MERDRWESPGSIAWSRIGKIAAAVAILVVVAVLYQAGTARRQPPPPTQPNDRLAEAVRAWEAEKKTSPPAPPEPIARWSYGQRDDPMGQGTAYFASVQSTNTVTFGSPYEGAQHATLRLRTHPRYGKDVILQIERGQFLCRSYDGCSVLVRFDDGEAQTYSASGPSDQSTEALFIHDYSRFVAGMLKASRVRISPEVYQEGVPVFEFDVRGFDVARYKPPLNR